VETVFGYPGGAILPTYDALEKYPQIHHVLPRHEQGATHMADGYARATGKVEVALGRTGDEIWVVAGDGGFQMTMAERDHQIEEVGRRFRAMMPFLEARSVPE